MERPEAKRSRPSWPSSRLRIPSREERLSKKLLYPEHPLDDFDDDFLDDEVFDEDPPDSYLTDDDPTLPTV